MKRVLKQLFDVHLMPYVCALAICALCIYPGIQVFDSSGVQGDVYWVTPFDLIPLFLDPTWHDDPVLMFVKRWCMCSVVLGVLCLRRIVPQCVHVVMRIAVGVYCGVLAAFGFRCIGSGLRTSTFVLLVVACLLCLTNVWKRANGVKPTGSGCNK